MTSYSALTLAEGVLEAVLHEVHGEVRDVDADPAALEALRYDDRRAATAEGVKHDVTLVAAGSDDALQQGLGLLCRVAEALGGLCVDRRDVGPDVLSWRCPASRRGTA